MQIRPRRNISRRYHRRVATPQRVARRFAFSDLSPRETRDERDHIGRVSARLDRNVIEMRSALVKHFVQRIGRHRSLGCEVIPREFVRSLSTVILLRKCRMNELISMLVVKSVYKSATTSRSLRKLSASFSSHAPETIQRARNVAALSRRVDDRCKARN